LRHTCFESPRPAPHQLFARFIATLPAAYAASARPDEPPGTTMLAAMRKCFFIFGSPGFTLNLPEL